MDHNSGRATLQYFTMPREEIYKDLSDWSVVTGGFTNSLALKVDMLLSSTSTSQARGKSVPDRTSYDEVVKSKLIDAMKSVS